MSSQLLIHRRTLTSDFVQIANSLAQDYDTLSAEAFGWLVRILSRPTNWRLKPKTLVADKPGRSRNHIYAVLRELRDAGFIVTVKRRTGGRYGCTDYHVFDEPQTAEQIAALCADCGVVPVTVSSSTTSHSVAHLKKTESKTDRATFQKDTADAVSRPAEACRSEGESLCAVAELPGEDDGEGDSGFDAAEVAAYLADRKPPAETPMFDLKSEDDDQPVKGLPWGHIERVMKRVVPEISIPTKAERRNNAMAKFWRAHGRSVSAFEQLAEKVQASDFIMARNGHTGRGGTKRPYPWSWVFGRKDSDDRAELILKGEYDNDRMIFILEKLSKPKLTKVIFTDNSTADVDLSEQHDGRPRYRLTGERTNNLPEAIDYKGQ